MSGTNLLHFLLTSRGIRNLLSRAYSLVQRFGFSPKKMESAIIQWLEISHKFSIRASFPITAIIVKRYPGVIKRLQANGLEFALHGYTHIDYSSLTMQEQLAHFNSAIKIFNSNVIPFDGFRAPYTRWSGATMEALRRLKISWDSSKTVIWDVLKTQNSKLKTQIYKKALTLYNPYSARDSPVLPELNNGCVEIPLCLPDDEMLVDRLSLPPQKIREVWEHMLALSYSRGELFTLQVHPERLPLCRDAVESVIRKAKKYLPRIWIANLSEIADWWNERAKFSAEAKETGNGGYKILFDCSPRATILLKNVTIEAVRSVQSESSYRGSRVLKGGGVSPLPLKIEDWHNSYQRVVGEVYELGVKSKVPPVIDIDNDCSPETINFIKSEGYILGKGGAYLDVGGYYNRPLRFEILDKIEKSGLPIIRFWRWPCGARSCLSITGDIDALTLFDFLLRAVGK